MLESLRFGAVRFGLEDAFDFLSMFDFALFGACFVYFHPVFGIVESVVE